jgi:MOSC domain-containing protein
MDFGTVHSIWRYPVKSLHFEALGQADVEATGLRGDRTSAYFVSSPDRPRFGNPFRGKENPTLHLLSDGPDVQAAAQHARVEIERRDGDRFFDAAPVSILFDRWLETLSEHVGYAVEPLRFRPNFFAVASREFADDETAFPGRTLTVGTVTLRVRKPIERCAVPTYDLNGGPSDPRILRFIAQQRENYMGIYCDVVEPGVVRVGDTIASS